MKHSSRLEALFGFAIAALVVVTFTDGVFGEDSWRRFFLAFVLLFWLIACVHHLVVLVRLFAQR